MKPTKNQTFGLQLFGRGGHAGASISSCRPGGPGHPPRVSRLQMLGTIPGWTALGWAVAYVALGLVEDLPGGESLGLAGWFDGLAHLVATALLAALILVWRRVANPGENQATLWWALVGSLAVGVGIELLQTRVPGRAFEWADLVADLAGAGLGVAAYVLAARVRGRDRLIVGGGVAAIVAAGAYILVAVLGM